jgi:hypothetical protein
LAPTLSILSSTLDSDPPHLRRWLEERLSKVWTDRWIRSPTRKQPLSRTPRAYLCGGHSSVYKIERGEHSEVSFEPTRAKDGRVTRSYNKKRDV